MAEHTERIHPDLCYRDQYGVFTQFLSRYGFASRIVGPRDSVLDLGCGCGHGSALLAEVRSRRVIGMDIAHEAVEFARDRYQSLSKHFIIGSATTIPLKDGSFDAIVVFEMLEHEKNAPAALKEARRVLRSDGVFIASTPNKFVTGMYDSPSNPYHVREYTPCEFKELMHSAFTEVILFGQLLSKACQRTEKQITAIHHNLGLLHDQVQALHARLRMDEYVLGLGMLRRFKRWLFPNRGARNSPLDRPLESIEPVIPRLDDWEVTPYAVDEAPVIVAVCR